MKLVIVSYAGITPYGIRINEQSRLPEEKFSTFAPFIKSLYKEEGINYPKFYKIDSLSKLGFLSAEVMMKVVNPALADPEKTGVVLSNAASSLDTDHAHQETIRNRSEYFPSPSVFVYTLPNIMIGEICIRHHLKGENAFLISRNFDSHLLYRYVTGLFQSRRVEACITGWVDLLKDQFRSLLMMVVPAEKAVIAEGRGSWFPFSTKTMDTLFNQT